MSNNCTVSAVELRIDAANTDSGVSPAAPQARNVGRLQKGCPSSTLLASDSLACRRKVGLIEFEDRLHAGTRDT